MSANLESMLCLLVKMEVTIVEEKESPFFKRKEIKALLKHSGSSTPNKAEVVKDFAARNSVDESQVVVDYIFTSKGVSESLAKIKILKEKPAPKEEVKKVEAPASQSA